MKQNIIFLIFVFSFMVPNYNLAQIQNENELNYLWGQADYWEKKGNIEKLIEYKEKLVNFYRLHNQDDLPLMLRNIANTYGALTEHYWNKSDNYLKEALSIIAKQPSNDKNLTLYYNCLGDIVGFNFIRKNYLLSLNYIKDYGNYLFENSNKIYKNKLDDVNNWKYNTIYNLNDSCKKLQEINKYEEAYNIMSSYAPEFIEILKKDSLITDIGNPCFITVWQYADLIENLDKYDQSLELRELTIRFLRNHIDYFLDNGMLTKEYLWSLERLLANKYSKIGNHQRDIELSSRIVQEVRETKDSLLLFEKIVDLGVSYDLYHTMNGREVAQKYFEESLDIIAKSPNFINSKEKTILVLDLLVGEYVLCGQYDKALNLFCSYQDFLDDIKEEYNNNNMFIDILRWKCSTYHHLNYSIPGSREEAKKINTRILDYQKNTFSEESVQYLSQLRLCSFTYQDGDSIELKALFNRGYSLWQKMPYKERLPEYASFLSSFLNYLYLYESVDLYRPVEKEMDYLCSTNYTGYHTKINYYYDRSIKEYNDCQYDVALDYILKAEEECKSHINDSEMQEKIAMIFNHKSRIYFCMNQYDAAKEYAYTAYSYIETSPNENLLKSDILYSLSYLMESFGEKEKAINLSFDAFKIRYKCDNGATPLDVISSTIYRLPPQLQISLLDTLHLENFLEDPLVVDLFITKAAAYINTKNFDMGEYYLQTAEKLLEIHKNSSIFNIGNRFNFVKSQLLYNKGVLAYMKNDYKKAISYFNDYRKTLGSDGSFLWLSTLYALDKDSANFEIEVSNYLDYIRKEITERFIYLSDHEREMYMSSKLSYTINEIESYANIYPESNEAKKAAFNAVLLEKGLALSTSYDILKILEESSLDLENLLALRRQFGLATDNEERSSIQLKISLEEQKLQKSAYDQINGLLNNLLVNYIDVKKHLNNESAIVEFVKTTSQNKSNLDATYGALILTKELDTPFYINLGNESQFYNLKSSGPIIYSKNSNDAYNLIWKPIIPYLEEKKNIYFSPTGLLHLLNIELIGNSNMHDINFVRLSSTRELCKNENKYPVEKKIVLFGGLCYDCEAQEGHYNSNNLVFLESLDDSVTRSGISYLPGSLEEINSISNIASSYNVRNVFFSGKDGSEYNYKMLSGDSIPILHLSTHGFSLGNNTEFEDPMRRCGLLLSSSQQAWNGIHIPDSEDGILLGEEIANVRLDENDIVVLSACESAIGETTSEGVWGLQRAFKKAGAKALLMSLWKVDDNATQLLMIEFYKQYLSGNNKQESLRLAQKYVQNHKDKDGNLLFEDPYYWAGFILLDALD